MLVFSIIFYLGALVGIILLYVFFTEVSCMAHRYGHVNMPLLLPSLPPQTSGCSLNKFFISSILILGVIVSVVSILPWVQRGKKTLLPVQLYYMTPLFRYSPTKVWSPSGLHSHCLLYLYHMVCSLH